MRTDAELLQAYHFERSEAAFAELVRRHARAVFSVACRRVGGDEHLAAEVAQDVFSDLARKAGQLVRRDSLMGWLFVSAQFAAAKAVRKRSRLAGLERELALSATEASASRPIHPGGPELDNALLRLAERERETVLLRFVADCSFAEIGLRLGISESAARMRVERALAKLRRQLEKAGIVSAGARLVASLQAQASVSVPPQVIADLIAAGLKAGSAMAGVPATAGLFLMTTKLVMGTAVVVLALGLAVLDLRQNREIRALRAQLAQQLELTSRAQRGLLQAESQQASTRAKLRPTHTAADAAPRSVEANPLPGESIVLHTRRLIQENPEYARLSRLQDRRLLMLQYQRGIASLQLGPDALPKLKDLLLERETARMDADDAAVAAGLKGPAIDQAKSAATKEVDRLLTELIGVAALNRLDAMRYAGLGNMNTNADLYGVDMAESGAPMTSEQSLTLSQLLFESIQDGGDVVARAQAVLSPAQWEAFRRVRDEEKQMKAVIARYLPPGFAGPLVIVP